MMPGIEFDYKVEGAEELKKKLTGDIVKTPLSEGLKKLIAWLHREVSTSTPVDTGRLRAGVTSEVAAEFGKVANSVYYAGFVEYGTSKMEARHVLPGTSTRVLGKGPFTRGMEELNKRIGDFLKDIGEAISVRFNG